MTRKPRPYARYLKQRYPASNLPIRSMRIGVKRGVKGDNLDLKRFNPLGGDEWEETVPEAYPEEFRFFQRINASDPTTILKHHGFCIYCGATTYIPDSNEPCHDEHIIQEGIGGNLVLSQSSCRSCANNINSYEGNLQRTTFYAARQRLGLRGKRRRLKPPLTIASLADENEIDIEIPIDKHPSMLLLPKYRPPGIMEFRPNKSNFLYNLWYFTFDDETAYISPAVEPYFSPEIDFLKFAKLLAKIAYSYTASVYDIKNFGFKSANLIEDDEINITKFIREITPHEVMDTTCFSHIGSASPAYKRSEYLHEIGHNTIDHGGLKLLCVFIRLFGNLGAPVHVIIMDYAL